MNGAAMMSSAAAAAEVGAEVGAGARAGTRGAPAAWLVRLFALNGGAIYMAGVSGLHMLREVPIHYTWMAGVLGFVILFLVIGAVATGRPLGLLSNRDKALSLDRLPVLLIWPIGLSTWGCLSLGLATFESKQHMANGLALPLTLLAAATAPLLLGYLPSWPKPPLLWQRLLNIVYALTALGVAATLFGATYQGLVDDPPMVVPIFDPATVAPGFACNVNADPLPPELAALPDNQCPKPPPTRVAKSASATALQLMLRPVDFYFPLWVAGLMLVAGCALAIGRAVGGGPPSHLAADILHSSLVDQLSGFARTGALAQASAYLRGSGLPGADMMADMVAKAAQPGAAPPPVEPTLSPPPPPAPAAAAQPVTQAEAKPNEQALAVSTLQAGVGALSEKLASQEAANSQLQSSVTDLHGRLEEHTGMLSRMAAETQQSMEENRRTTDNLSRLMQSMNAELVRMSRNPTGA